ncbi:hypothetical protein [Autumnicola psychrophila]|uniref:Uncharacterized protein n=1 Tax=Autumnicola psychrophila TaxID=3075592 RepID=A0ABU3DU33_9FLAO|nr:hypothetical protein [Zunongwangia sp. F225]MDT0687228.1 hypothetical protein [Zunongwangia sp. F225]
MKNKIIIVIFFLIGNGLTQAQKTLDSKHESSPSFTSDIRLYDENPRYWEYKNEPILLYGGSDNDNLWQWSGAKLTKHLDLLKSLGGNYVRNTMSDRDEGDTYAFSETGNGKYNLEEWNETYWEKLEFFLGNF